MGLERLRVEKCCCCASLRTGCLIIAILSLEPIPILRVLFLPPLIRLMFLRNASLPLNELSTLATIFGMSGNLIGGSHMDDGKNKVTYQANMIMKGLICAISLCLCIALVYGTIKKNRKLIKAWVILKGIECVLVVLMIIKIIYTLAIAHSSQKGVFASILVGAIIELILCCYCWLVVWSHYLELGDEEVAAANINLPEGTKLNDVNASSNC